MFSQYDLDREIGRRNNLQTLYHPTNKEWYTVENIFARIKKYEERLKFHQSLYDVRPNDELKKAIKKDKELIAKWKNFYRTQGKIIKVK